MTDSQQLSPSARPQAHDLIQPICDHLYPDSATKTQIRDLLRSHSMPPDHIPSIISAVSNHIAQHNEEISTYECEISRYENEISRLRAQLARAKSDRAALQSHCDNLVSLLSPIRRLPSEILVQIFALCRITSDLNLGPSDSEDVVRLKQKPLLAVSQVCARWHGIAMGTPTLWDVIYLYGPPLWRSSGRARRGMRLLRLALERSQNSSLDISIIDPFKYNPPLDLLATHSERCKTVDFVGPFPQIQRFFSATAKFPSLETLTVFLFDQPGGEIDFLELAPRLKTFIASVPLLTQMTNLPLHRLQTFGCLTSTASEVTASMGFMARTPTTTRFRLEIFISNWTHDNVVGFDIPPTSSNISHLSMEIRDYFLAERCVKALSDIFTGLTLPHLQQLSFWSSVHSHSPMHWPHSAFLSLAVRSSFHNQLRSLNVCHVVVTEAHLVECLAVLPSLQRLAIADHKVVGDNGDGADEHLITDSLLSQLTLAPNSPSLVPQLRSLTCDSLLKFDDGVYLRFLLSRRQRAPGAAPFLCKMYWLDGHRRELDSNVIPHLRQMRIEKEVVCEFSCSQRWIP
ncbi:hypothetical protein FB451DRAFT_1363169 [Mycena latifolia]|nr:hypothetical protein FB451DRAFT_1363169 [Mycena latifolia]